VIAAGVHFPNLVNRVIVSGSHLFGPVVNGIKYGNRSYSPIGMDTHQSRAYGGKSKIINFKNRNLDGKN